MTTAGTSRGARGFWQVGSGFAEALRLVGTVLIWLAQPGTDELRNVKSFRKLNLQMFFSAMTASGTA
jgi:hypothetical protein